jgi:ABC-type dipeptide/oligopeptide/nickel transport system ATPase component
VSLLSVRGLVVRFGTEEEPLYAVNGVDLELEGGDTLGLVGESGSGKTVTSLAIIGLLPRPGSRIERGQIIFQGTDLTNLPESELRRLRGKEIAMVFQDPMTSLNPV